MWQLFGRSFSKTKFWKPKSESYLKQTRNSNPGWVQIITYQQCSKNRSLSLINRRLGAKSLKHRCDKGQILWENQIPKNSPLKSAKSARNRTQQTKPPFFSKNSISHMAPFHVFFKSTFFFPFQTNLALGFLFVVLSLSTTTISP